MLHLTSPCCTSRPTTCAASTGRECFLDILTEESGEFVLEECADRRVAVWEADGGRGGEGGWRDYPIAFMALRRTYTGDTVGVKALRR